jgi:hypothetical protein
MGSRVGAQPRLQAWRGEHALEVRHAMRPAYEALMREDVRPGVDLRRVADLPTADADTKNLYVRRIILLTWKRPTDGLGR